MRAPLVASILPVPRSPAGSKIRGIRRMRRSRIRKVINCQFALAAKQNNSSTLRWRKKTEGDGMVSVLRRRQASGLKARNNPPATGKSRAASGPFYIPFIFEVALRIGATDYFRLIHTFALTGCRTRRSNLRPGRFVAHQSPGYLCYWEPSPRLLPFNH